MVVTSSELLQAKYAENADTIQVTGSGIATIIDKFTVTNVTASPASFTAYITAPLGVPGLSNKIINSRTIAASETYTCPELIGHTLGNGSIIATFASASSSLVIRCSGRILTSS